MNGFHGDEKYMPIGARNSSLFKNPWRVRKRSCGGSASTVLFRCVQTRAKGSGFMSWARDSVKAFESKLGLTSSSIALMERPCQKCKMTCKSFFLLRKVTPLIKCEYSIA